MKTRFHRFQPSILNSSFVIRHSSPLCLLILLLLAPGTALPGLRAAEDLSATLQRGLFEEEANNNLPAAIKAYEAVISATDAQRKLAGTALFRLAECQRKLGRTNDAVALYQRVLREYPDQTRLADLSRQYVVTKAPAEFGKDLGTERIQFLEHQLLNHEVEYARIAALHRSLTNLTRAELKRIVPSTAPDPVLSTLLEQRSKAEQRVAGLQTQVDANGNRINPNHPDFLSAGAALQTIDKQIDERLDGIVASIALKVSTEKAALDQAKKSLEEARGAGGTSALSQSARAEQKRLLEEEIKIAQLDLEGLERLGRAGASTVGALSATQSELIALHRKLAALADSPGDAAAASAVSTPTDEEDKEVRRIQALIKDSPDLINARGQDSLTPLQTAAKRGQLVVARFLLSNGADPNLTGGNGLNSLHEAAKAGHKSMTELLLASRAGVNALGAKKQTALHLAVEDGFKSVVEVLLTRKADPSLADSNGDTPLHIGAKSNRPLVEMLVNAGAQVDVKNLKGRTPLSIASERSKEIVEFLLAKGADPNVQDAADLAPLHYAVTGPGPKGEITAVLLEHKANPNVADKSGNTPLHMAATANQLAVVQALLAGGADANVRTGPFVSGGNKSWYTPLWNAVSNERAEVTAALLKGGADPNLVPGLDPNTSWTVLHLGCSKNYKAIVRLLLEAGANPNVTVLASYKNSAVVEWTPLLMAARDGWAELLHLLLEAKADPNFVADITALGYVIQSHKSTNMVADLLAHGADIEAESPGYDTKTPLATAAASDNDDIVELLLKHKANPNSRGKERLTPLHFAAVFAKSRDVFELLLNHGADPNTTDAHGRTPLDILKTRSGPSGPGGSTARAVPTRPGVPSVRPIRQETSSSREQPQPATPSELADLLRQHGALDEVPLTDRIQVGRPVTQKQQTVFTKGTNDWNRFTLLELIAVHYGFLSTSVVGTPSRVWYAPYYGGIDNQSKSRDLLPFPDLARVSIRRLAPDKKSWKEIKVNVQAILKSGDRAKDVPLEWGDVVEIPESDHSISARWGGFDKEVLRGLKQALARQVSITVKGDTLRTNLVADIMTMAEADEIRQGANEPVPVTFRANAQSEAPAVLSNRRLTLHSLLYDSGLLRSSSDASRVRVKRPDDGSGKPREWVVNCADPNNRPDLWLRDGDVIEVPERE